MSVVGGAKNKKKGQEKSQWKKGQTRERPESERRGGCSRDAQNSRAGEGGSLRAKGEEKKLIPNGQIVTRGPWVWGEGEV